MNKSDTRRVAGDTRRDRDDMTMSTVDEASFYLNELTRAEHRGRGDTWTAARDRAARKAGIEPSYAKRLWDRCRTMKDMSAEAYSKLRRSYEAACEKNEASAAAYKAERLELARARRDAVDTRENHARD